MGFWNQNKSATKKLLKCRFHLLYTIGTEGCWDEVWMTLLGKLEIPHIFVVERQKSSEKNSSILSEELQKSDKTSSKYRHKYVDVKSSTILTVDSASGISSTLQKHRRKKPSSEKPKSRFELFVVGPCNPLYNSFFIRTLRKVNRVKYLYMKRLACSILTQSKF